MPPLPPSGTDLHRLAKDWFGFRYPFESRVPKAMDDCVAMLLGAVESEVLQSGRGWRRARSISG